ncbi:Bug family tripartite tricarboxylate transporter substrate binding protein [Bordetella genomosp. 13]|uniref:Bug family tripartite tricarboxylate transporter substrate binding protein n=1 Tax=Bordetella genomosp. 13 TaxID=463040 RepID=UPI0011A24B10|nr:tripartite tricarboxylate transporter substrate binding protein [Bordetella genomosp. 13]
MNAVPAFRSLRRLGALLLASLVAAPAAQAAYPEKPIQVIISFPPAGATDVLARAVGQKLAAELNQSVVVQNRPGAGGAIGLVAAARAPADGYTLYLAAVTNTQIARAIYKDWKADLETDFVPVAGVGAVPHALVVPTSLGIHDVAGLAAFVKQAPGKYNFASQGTGTLSHLESELFAAKAGLQMVHIPYKGSVEALPDVASGSSAMMFDSLPSSMPLVSGGKLRYLAVASKARVSLLPDVPTLAEAGVPGVAADNLFGFVAPKGTPPEAVRTLSRALRKVLAQPDLKAALAQQGAELQFTDADELRKAIAQEREVWSGVVKEFNVQPQ